MSDHNADYFIENSQHAELVGIVTVLYNSNDVLEEFFSSLAIQTQANIRIKLYVIDNSSNDSGCILAAQLADRYSIDTKIHFNNKNNGVALGNNQGIAFARNDNCNFVLLSNNDIVFDDPNLISGLIRCMRENRADAIVPKIFYAGDPKRLWFAGGRFRRIAATTPHFGDGHFDDPKYNIIGLTEYAPTCFMLMQVDIFSSVGVMDEKYFVYYDDSDFVRRMAEAGKKILYAPNFSLTHKVSFSTGGAGSEFSLFYMYRNRIYFIRKFYSVPAALLSYFYIGSSLAVKFFRFSRAQRKVVLRGLSAGFKL